MWHLIRLVNQKDKEEAEELLRASLLPYTSIASLIELYRPQPAIANLLLIHGKGMYLVEVAEERMEAFTEQMNSHKKLFQRVRCKTGDTGHVCMDEEELDSLVLLLQTPHHYTVIQAAEMPAKEDLKDITVMEGPLKGLKGKFLNRKTPAVKRCYLPVLSLFHIEIKIPIKDIRKDKQEKRVEISYLLDDRKPHWYLLSARKREQIEKTLGNTLNPWNGTEDEEAMSIRLDVPQTEQTVYTTRYLYQAIYRRKKKEGVEDVDLMPHRFFFRTNRYDLETFRGPEFDTHIYIMRNTDGTPVQIPDRQMEIFARFLQERSEATEALYEDYRKGDVAHIAMGIEKENEIEGTVEVVTKNHYILISENGFKINVKKRKKKK